MDVQDAGKSSEPDDKGLHTESQIGEGHNILSSETALVCSWGNKSSLGVKLREMHASITKKALATQKNQQSNMILKHDLKPWEIKFYNM